MRLGAALLVASALAAPALVACKAEPPDVDDPDPGGADAGLPYADAVLGWTEGVEIMSCGAEGATCGGALPDCGPTQVLGAPDGATFDVAPNGVIEVALLCSYIAERGGGTSPDLKLWATFADGASAVVEVSYDGTVWETLLPADTSDPELDLAQGELQVARFVRITNRGNAAISLDAVEALR